MATLTIPNVRVSSDIRLKVTLTDNGVSVDWSSINDISAIVYFRDQRMYGARAVIEEIDGTDLILYYSADRPQFLGIADIVINCEYQGFEKTFDKPAVNFVDTTQAASGTISVTDDTIAVDIAVEEVDTSILDNAIAAAYSAAEQASSAADRAAEAAEAAEHMIDIHTGPEGKSAYEVAVEEGYTGTEEEWLASLKGPVGETPDISIGTVTTVESGTPAAASITGTPEAPLLNLSIPRGPVGATGNGIASIVETVESAADAGTNEITVIMTDATTATFRVKNGSKGTPGVANAKYKQVDTLPTASADTMDFIYLTPSGTSGVYNMSYTDQDGNSYTWKDLGTTAIQLSDYATKTEVSQLALEVNGVTMPDYDITGQTSANTYLRPHIDYVDIQIAPGVYNLSSELNGTFSVIGFYFYDSGGNILTVQDKNGNNVQQLGSDTIAARSPFTLPAGIVRVGFNANNKISDGSFSLNLQNTVEDVPGIVDEVNEIENNLADLSTTIGEDGYTEEKTVSGSFNVEAFGSRVSLTDLSIPQGKTIRIEVGGTSTRDTQRLYINTAGGTQIAVPASGPFVLDYVAETTITALYFSAAVTGAGTIEMKISYDVAATGIIKSINEFNELKPNLDSIIGVVKEQTVQETPTWSIGANANHKIYDSVIKNDNCTLSCRLSNLVGSYSTIRVKYASGQFDYFNLSKVSETVYYGEKTLSGVAKGSPLTVTLYTDSTHTGSASGSCNLEIKEQARTGSALLRVDIYNTETQLEIYNKMLWANNVGRCDVHFQPGTYYFTETLYDYLKQEKGLGRFELPIGGGCKYHFNGAKLVGSYSGSDTQVHQNCNVIGCALTSGNFELFDGIIEANDIIYGVHDDVGNGLGDSHIHKYHNMHIIYNGGTFAASNAICKCIGGGTGKNLTVVIDGCILEKYTENANKDCVTYHGFSYNPSYTTRARIIITNTWMNGWCRAYHLVASDRNETIEFAVSNSHANIGSLDVDSFFSWNIEALS